jgi:hypothetical protein
LKFITAFPEELGDYKDITPSVRSLRDLPIELQRYLSRELRIRSLPRLGEILIPRHNGPDHADDYVLIMKQLKFDGFCTDELNIGDLCGSMVVDVKCMLTTTMKENASAPSLETFVFYQVVGGPVRHCYVHARFIKHMCDFIWNGEKRRGY